MYAKMWLTAIAWLCLLGPSSFAQDPTRRVFRSGISLVQVDVSVLDERGEPVRGLDSKTFQVFEDGKPQKIVSFLPVEVSAPAVPAPWSGRVPLEVTANQSGSGRASLILLDDATMPFEVKMMATAKEAARNIVSQMGPDDSAAVVFTADNRNALDFTADKVKLLAAIDTFRAGWMANTYQRDSSDYQMFRMSSRTLVKAVESLSLISDRRKSVFFISSGSSAPNTDVLGRLYRLAQAANVTVHPVDPSGLGLEDYLRHRLLGMRATAGTALQTAHDMARAAEHHLQGLATNTGGVAVLRTNDVEPGIARIFNQTSSYYLLAYESSIPNHRFRRTEVRVVGEGLQVQARKGAWAPSSERRREGEPLSEAAIAGVLPSLGLPLRVHYCSYRGAGKSASVVATVGVGGTKGLSPQRVVIAAFDPEGRDRGIWRLGAGDISARPSTDGYVEFGASLELKPGRYTVRVGVEQADGKSGSVYSHLTVPNYESEPVSMSGVLVSGTAVSYPTASSGPASHQPTTRRSFSTQEVVAAQVRVYQAGGRPQPVVIESRLTDVRGVERYKQSRSLGESDLAGPEGVAHAISIPTVDLQPGPYLVSIKATLGDGSAAVRHVEFSVR